MFARVLKASSAVCGSASARSALSGQIIHKALFSTAAAASAPAQTRMRGKVCIVTGGGAGLGLGIAQQYAREGAKVVISDLNVDAASKAASDLRAQGLQAISVKTDITNEDEVRDLVKFAVEQYGPLDVIVSNAGFQHIEPVHELSLANWKKMMSVHLDGSFLCTKYAVQEMKKDNRGGSIIYMGSVHSKLASLLKAPYVTAKHGLLGLSRAVARETAPFNIRTNVICPGFVLTKLVKDQIPQQAARLNITEEEVVKNVMLKDTVNGQFTTVEDIAEVATVFASFPSNALTGQSLVASHGWCME